LRLPTYNGPNDIRKVDAKLFNQYVGLLYQFWNDTDSGAISWTNLDGGSFKTATITKAVNYTVALTDQIILVDSTSGVLTVTLPSAVGITGQQFSVKDWKGQSATNNITIATTSSQTIDGVTTKILNVAYVSYALVSDGANWAII
jgi:hypothetical protein